MLRKVLVATVATAPLLAMAFGALAETQVTTARTTPIATATANNGAADDVTVTSAGSISLTTAGALVTLNSNNKVASAGALSTTGVSDSVGVLVLGGFTGSVTNTGSIQLLEDYTPTDTDGDGDIDGPFAQGANRYGIRLTGPGAFTGPILNDTAGIISIEGNNSRGVSIESQLNGDLTNKGSIQVTGDNAAGVMVAAPVTGNVTIGGSVTVLGKNAVGLAIDSNVTGALALQGAINATGYRYTARADETSTGKLDADDLLQGGPGVRVAGDVTGGVLLNGPSASIVVDGTTTTTNTVSSSTTGTASITTYGAAPALQIGSDTRAVAIGAVGTADNAYGLISKGAISASGVYDKVTATGVQIGGKTGQTTTVAGGARIDGSITASAREANATGLGLSAGATAPSLWNRGVISANSGSFAASGITADARGVVIDAGASATDLTNAGSIVAVRTGETGNAIGVLDSAGALKTITNSGTIVAQVGAPTSNAAGTAVTVTAAGSAIALDLRASTTGVTVKQQAPTTTAVTSTYPSTDTVTTTTTTATTTTPSIVGDILFGSGNDTLNVQVGNIVGAMSFGAGADSLILDGGATALGSLRDSDGRLSVSIGSATLGLTNAETINLTSLNLGAGSKLIFTADPTTGAATKLVVSGATTIASGADLGIRLTGLLKAPTTYTVIQSGTLTAGTFSQGLVDSAPYLYVAKTTNDASNVYIDVRRRTAAEAGLSREGTQAYDAVFGALGADSALANTFLAQNTKDGFNHLYNQMLPDLGEGLFATLQGVNQQISAATAVQPDRKERYGPDSIWVQEINSLVRTEDGDTQGSDAKAFGFVAGYEAMGDAGGALGLTLAYVSIEEHDNAAQVGEQTTASFVQGGAYWRRSIGGLRLNVGGGGGYGWFTGDRRFIAGDANNDGVVDLILKNSADWTGATFNGYAGAAYEAKLGRFYARPEARLDYVWLREGERKESGGGAIDQLIAERTSSNLSGEAGIAFGADMGRDLWWRPEVRVGYRQTLAGQVGDTVARFYNVPGANPFTITPMDDKQGALTLGFALRAGTSMSYVALEGGAEATKRQKRYNLRLTGRAMF
ncbi:MAG: Autotransporter beta-domain protein [Caulobacter sp.]|nr:Autotransporter beta-domain protein [Caulobacter sp.]